MSDIWNIQSPEDLVSEMANAVLEKCDYGEHTEVLTPEERRFYLVHILWMEVNNGGFDQYFCNSSGDDAPETLAVLRSMGANFVADLMEKSLIQFGETYPTDWDERNDLTNGWEEEDPRFAVMAECADAFYEDEAGDACLNACCHAFLLKNKDAFQVEWQENHPVELN